MITKERKPTAKNKTFIDPTGQRAWDRVSGSSGKEILIATIPIMYQGWEFDEWIFVTMRDGNRIYYHTDHGNRIYYHTDHGSLCKISQREVKNQLSRMRKCLESAELIFKESKA